MHSERRQDNRNHGVRNNSSESSLRTSFHGANGGAQALKDNTEEQDDHYVPYMR